MATPLTELRLLNNVDLDTTYNNTFSQKLFTTLAGQITFFQGKTVYTHTGLTFQRKEKAIRIDRPYEQIEPLTYGMFKNKTNGKWYFFFITDMVYVNERTTDIIIEIDVEQTYLFDVSFRNSFIEREHTQTDGIGDHFIDEGLAVNEIVSVSTETVSDLSALTYVLATTVDSTGADVEGGIYTGLYSGLAYYASDDVGFVNAFIALLASLGKLEALKNIFVMPKNLIDDIDPDLRIQAPNAKYLLKTFSKNYSTIDGYTPKNNKLFTYPYNYLHVSNNQGNDAILKYEFFSAGDCGFTITCDVAPTPTVFMVPLNYRGVTVNNEDLITLGKYPLCNWTGDIYSNWLAQNQVSNAVGVAGSLLSLGVGVATGNPIAIGGGVLGVASTIGGFYEKSIEPNKSRGQQSGGGNIAANVQNFNIYKKCVTAEFARIIDDFFTKFGYKVNVLKTPSVVTRPRFNYIKTQETILRGNIPRESLKMMIANREKGMTFWHVDDIGNYAPSNSISGGSGGGTEPPDPPGVEYESNSLGWAFPLELGKAWVLTSPYGMRIHPITGLPTFHYGVDLAAAAGVDVVSVLSSGMVVEKDFSSARGNYVRVSYGYNGKTYLATYQHLLNPGTVTVGQQILKGAKIGDVGSTGDSTGNHLHFDLKENGDYVDPWLYIKPTL